MANSNGSGQLDRPAGPARLHLGADPPHARRHPPPDLGPRRRLWAERARMARRRPPWSARSHSRCLSGWSAFWRWEARDERISASAHPLGRVRGLGAAHSGTRDFWRQRITSVAAIPLTIAAVVIVILLLGRNQAAAVQILGSPLVAIIMLLFIVSTRPTTCGSACRRSSRIMSTTKTEAAALMANTFFTIAVGLASAFAILKLSFGV